MKAINSITALALMAASAMADCTTLDSNADYWGNDIATTERGSAEECCGDCEATPGCSLFVWFQGTCWLKSKAGPRSSVPGAHAGFVQNKCGSLQMNTDFFGNDIGSTNRASPTDCCGDCLARPGCVVSVWYQGTCWLKDTVGSKSTLPGAIAVMPSNGNTPPAPAPAPAPGPSNPLPLKNIKGGYGYLSTYRSGTYEMVTSLSDCQKRTEYSAGPIAPYHEDVSFVFRGPMDIYNIAIFQPSGDRWSRVSSYNQGTASNMVFMNNANPQKYNGLSPQGYAQADGIGFSKTPVNFGGRLNDGSNPSDQYGGPGITTGAEVNIMLPTKCTSDSCKGYFDPVYGHHGWSGSKVFVAKVKMDVGGVPAIWALNAQVVRSNQYGCNCRGMADPGGCGEFDIAEVIYRGANTVSTHNYWLNKRPSAGHDTWATIPTNEASTFVAILDEASGTIKVLHLRGDDFGAFNVDSISNQAMSELINHGV